MCQYLLATATLTSTLRHLTCNHKGHLFEPANSGVMCSLQLPSEHPRDPGTARLRLARPSSPCVSGGQLTPSEKPPGSSRLQEPREASATKPHVEAPSKSYPEAMLELCYAWICLVHTPNIRSFVRAFQSLNLEESHRSSHPSCFFSSRLSSI